jgi:hypothetical protein
VNTLLRHYYGTVEALLRTQTLAVLLEKRGEELESFASCAAAF